MAQRKPGGVLSFDLEQAEPDVAGQRRTQALSQTPRKSGLPSIPPLVGLAGYEPSRTPSRYLIRTVSDQWSISLIMVKFRSSGNG